MMPAQRARHTIIEYDPVRLTGICGRCGPVQVVKRVDKRRPNRPYYVCRAGAEESWARLDTYPDNRPNRHRLTREQARERLRGRWCEICGDVPAETNDHSHATGGLRGALCHSCNRRLGLAGDDAEWLAAAAAYLSRWQ